MINAVDLIRRSISILSVVCPPLAGRVALAAFFATRPRRRVQERDRATQDSARRGVLLVRGEKIVSYRWGDADDIVLLVHGWRGRASQFSPLVRELVRAGWGVVSFDAPGHGDSPGRRTDIRDWLSAIEQLQAQHGPFRAIVGHSFGTLAALTAVRQGIVTRAVVSIAGAGSTAAFVEQFSRLMGLTSATRRVLEHSFRDRLDADETSIVARYDAIRHPLPADIPLVVVHDEDDRQLAIEWSEQLAESHAGRVRLVRTRGAGHTRVLAADLTLDAVLDVIEHGAADRPHEHGARSA